MGGGGEDRIGQGEKLSCDKARQRHQPALHGARDTDEPSETSKLGLYTLCGSAVGQACPRKETWPSSAEAILEGGESSQGSGLPFLKKNLGHASQCPLRQGKLRRGGDVEMRT